MVVNVRRTGNGPFDPDVSPVRNHPLAEPALSVASLKLPGFRSERIMRLAVAAVEDPGMRWPSVAVTAIVLAGCGGAASTGTSATTVAPTTVAPNTTMSLATTTSVAPTTTVQATTTSATPSTVEVVGTTAAAPAPLGTVADYVDHDQLWTMSITGWDPDATAAVARSDRYGVAKASPGQVLATVSVHTTHVRGQPDASPIGVNLLVAGPSGVEVALDVGCTVVVNPGVPRTSWLVAGDSVDEQVCFELSPADAAGAVALLQAPAGTNRYLALR
jgi:hypothetical protein